VLLSNFVPRAYADYVEVCCAYLAQDGVERKWKN
jgi:hypothetical protein